MGTGLHAQGAEILRPLEELTRVESVKAGSRQLRGTIAEELQSDAPQFSDPAESLLKFHGVYQQDDRDARKAARRSGGGKQHIMMVRTRIPGGIVSAEAYLAHDEVARRHANGTLRITTRQDFQLHGVLKGNLKATIRRINEALLTTLGGCGDQERNIMCCPLPRKDGFTGQITEALRGLVRNLTPTTQAYTEIWLDAIQLTGTEPQIDELYGPTYLPRKFKTAVAPEGDNCVDVYSNDLGFVAHRAPGGGLAGFTVLAGGGLGRTHHKPDTFALLSRPMAFATPDQAIPVARAVVAVQRDFGNRHDRRHARLKYLIHERGLDWFRDRVQERLGFTLADPHPLHWDEYDDHLGWYRQGDGFLAYGLFVENGRIQDTPELPLRTLLRRLVEELRPRVVLTPQQNLILSGIAPRDRGRVEELLAVNAVRPLQALPLSLRHSMACPALPTCGQAVAEAERVAPALIRQIDDVIRELGLQGERISYRMTGCPNACARPYLGDVGIVGTTLGKYDIHLGGDIEGTRLNDVFAENVPLERIAAVLRTALEAFVTWRVPGETFGGFCHRVGVATLAARVLPAELTTAPAEADGHAASATADALISVAAGNGRNGRNGSSGSKGEASARLAALKAAVRIPLDPRQQADVHCLAVGAFSPLTGFLGSEDHETVCATMRLRSGAVWSMPVVLAIGARAPRARPGETAVLLGTDGEPLALLDVEEVYRVDLAAEVERCYGTADPAHPGVAARLAQGDHCVAGTVHALRLPHTPFPEHDLTPAQTRARFRDLGWRTVVGFQTRNPVHRAHEYLHKVALESIDGLFLQPLVGETKDDDIPAAVRMRCYQALLDGYYPPGRVVLGTFPAAMRYAGPREAVLHACVRRNYGCTHFIVGRDHAGVGNYYGTHDAQRIFEGIDKTALGIEILAFEHTFWCRACAAMASARTCPHDREQHLVLSGTRLREMLSSGELPPAEFSRPEVARILIEAGEGAAA